MTLSDERQTHHYVTVYDNTDHNAVKASKTLELLVIHLNLTSSVDFDRAKREIT